jgi:hypothetical protein
MKYEIIRNHDWIMMGESGAVEREYFTVRVDGELETLGFTTQESAREYILDYLMKGKNKDEVVETIIAKEGGE